MVFDFRIKAKQSLAIVKQLSRLAQGQCFSARHWMWYRACTQIYTHVYTLIWGFTRLTWRLCFPCSGRWGISFLAMCCFLASERLCSFLLEGAAMGKCLHQSNPTCLLPNVSFLLFVSPPSSLFPSSCISLCLSILLSLSPSICYPPWADICCQAALLFCSSDFWLGFFRSLSFSLSWSLSLSVFFLLPSPANSTVQ